MVVDNVVQEEDGWEEFKPGYLDPEISVERNSNNANPDLGPGLTSLDASEKESNGIQSVEEIENELGLYELC